MSELRCETWTIPAAALGEENPLPALRPRRQPRGLSVHESIPPQDRALMGYGQETPVLPYRLQDGYERQLTPRSFAVAVLENEYLRAAFLLEFGGRLWSLVHKPSVTELLFRNPAFQPANFAIRNAWLAGGVEWNCGLHGHSPHTLSPLFAAQAWTDDGQPVLRFYEWERVRQTPYQLDLFLPDGSPFLFSRGRIINDSRHVRPMYWWSNIAVRETEDLRVLAPAPVVYSRAYSPDGRLAATPLTGAGDSDPTYPARAHRSADAYFRIPDGRRPWIVAVQRDGSGLVHVSTQRLRGRKLFRWGRGPGGRHWQEFLCGPGGAYCEIQGGLTTTQSECMPMPPGACWEWLEAYGRLECAADTVHGSDWMAAIDHVQTWIDAALPRCDLEHRLRATRPLTDRAAAATMHLGSGWAALERRRRQAHGERWRLPAGISFPDESMGENQAPWLALLETGILPRREPDESPGAFMTQTEWRQLLEASLRCRDGDHWLAWLHAGVMRWAAGETEAAAEAWETSVCREDNPWAWRNLALWSRLRDRREEAVERYRRAVELAPPMRALAVEQCETLLQAGRNREALEALNALPAEWTRNGRLRALRCRALIELGRLGEAENLLAPDLVVPDVREGELSLSELWFRLHERRLAEAENATVDDAFKRRVRDDFPLPAHLDFRMHAG